MARRNTVSGKGRETLGGLFGVHSRAEMTNKHNAIGHFDRSEWIFVPFHTPMLQLLALSL